MKFCSKCGIQLMENDAFCPECGTELQQEAKQNEVQPKEDVVPTHQEIETFPTKKNKKGIVTIVILASVILLLVTTFATLALTGAIRFNEENEKETPIRATGIDSYGGSFTVVYDENGNETDRAFTDGYWWKYEYDENGNETYYEDSDGYWEKREYDENGYRTYYEDSDGYWAKYTYEY